jgi:predicted transcriptional regulator
METTELVPAVDLEAHVAEIVSSYLKKNQMAPADLPALITSVYQSLQSLVKAQDPELQTPAVSVRQSVTRDYVICLDCGWRGVILRRHIAAMHGLNNSEYRAKWNLPHEHALTAPAYSERRAAIANQIGLGQRMGRNRDQPDMAGPSGSG